MNKNNSGKKISVVLTVLLCFVAAFLLWLYVGLTGTEESAVAMLSEFRGL